MKLLIKKYSKVILFAGVCLFSCKAFSASEATKKLIHETLAKYGISAGGKEVCGTGREPEYNKTTGVVKCKNDKQGDTNNCWDASSRLCKECPAGTVVSTKDHITCRQIVCPEGWELVEIKDGNCPEGFEKERLTNTNSCPTDFEPYTEKQATKDYATFYKKCSNLEGNFNNPFFNPIIFQPSNPELINQPITPIESVNIEKFIITNNKGGKYENK